MKSWTIGDVARFLLLVDQILLWYIMPHMGNLFSRKCTLTDSQLKSLGIATTAYVALLIIGVVLLIANFFISVM